MSDPLARISELRRRLADAALEEAIGCHLELAAIAGDELGDGDLALASIQAILDLDPAHEGALVEYQRLCEASARWSEAVDVLERRIELAADPETRSVLLERAALLCEELLADGERAGRLRKLLADLAGR